MPDYQLQIKQLVDYPRCRLYRQFMQSLINDRNIRTNGGSGLFYYTVLCSYTNFRTSYRYLDGISYTVYPGEWVCSIKELSAWFRTRFHHQVFSILDELQKKNLISYLVLGHKKAIKYKIRNWKEHNTVLDYNCPCQKDTGFFFMPVATAAELIGSGRCSEMDVVLDLWISTIYNNNQVQGSDIGPVVYLRNGTGCPLVTYQELAARWGLSKTTTGRLLKKLNQMDYISLTAFPGRTGSVIYLRNYLSTMFQISDVLIDKEEIAMCLNLNITLPDEPDAEMASSLAPDGGQQAAMPEAEMPHPETNIPGMPHTTCGADFITMLSSACDADSSSTPTPACVADSLAALPSACKANPSATLPSACETDRPATLPSMYEASSPAMPSSAHTATFPGVPGHGYEADFSEFLAGGHTICVSKKLSSVSKTHIGIIIEKLAQVLDSQGISCFRCPKSTYKLLPLSDDCREEYIHARATIGTIFLLTVLCASGRPVRTFELTLTPIQGQNCQSEKAEKKKEDGRIDLA